MKKISVSSMVLAVLFLLGACSVLPTHLEKDFGNSVKISRSNQTLNLEAAKNLEPVTGLDGKAAQVNMEKYRKAFEAPSAPPQYILQMGNQGK